MSGEPTFLIMSRGTMKIALPITVPTTIAAALQTPRSRFRSNALAPSGGLSGIGRFLYHYGRYQTGEERSCGANQNVPGEGDVGPLLDVDHNDKPSDHGNDGGILLNALGEQ